MSWKIVFTPQAKKSLKAIKNKKVQKQILDTLKALSIDPDIEKRGKRLSGELSGFRSIRVVGRRYRIIYKMTSKELIITVIHVEKRESGSKKDIYELTKKLLKLGLTS